MDVLPMELDRDDESPHTHIYVSFYIWNRDGRDIRYIDGRPFVVVGTEGAE